MKQSHHKEIENVFFFQKGIIFLINTFALLQILNNKHIEHNIIKTEIYVLHFYLFFS